MKWRMHLAMIDNFLFAKLSKILNVVKHGQFSILKVVLDDDDRGLIFLHGALCRFDAVYASATLVARSAILTVFAEWPICRGLRELRPLTMSELVNPSWHSLSNRTRFHRKNIFKSTYKKKSQLLSLT